MGFYLSELFVMVQLNQMEYSLKSILVYSHKWKKKTVFDIASRHNSAAKTAAASTNSGQSPAFRQPKQQQQAQIQDNPQHLG